ncbi:Mandelamide hydrolase [Paraburkholderia domus]|uniref:amidase family protein n=1 Tax=Paraburkholderia domus TaxID=2793075 RepID=UPI001913E2EF|nr:amidase family protein [Paraburkholderia domus]MBK5091273.1 amidase [Burkholderia sp. R-69927]CAE6931436.1 Mandelamide hydrolase [Paraburkholderia domus]
MFKSKCLITVTLVALSTLSSLSRAGVAPDKIVKLSLPALRQALDKGEVQAVDVVSAYMSEINANNARGKKLNAIITINPDALAQAKAWDENHSQHPAVPGKPLSGIPFLAKDSYETKGIVTSGGSIALSTSKPDRNAFVINKLLDDGAILLGKTNMSELAASYGWLGYSSYGGQTVNPYNPLRDPSGSSSGSAAAVAAHFAPFALGTDTSGSMRGPASVTGTVGMRPTLGLTSRSGIIPLSLTADDAGVITRTVEDQAIVLDVIRGQDTSDAATTIRPQPTAPFVASLDRSVLSGKTIAVVDNFDGGNPDVDRIKQSAVSVLQHAGANIVHITLPKVYEDLWSVVMGPVGVAEFRAQFEAYLSTLPNGQPRNMTQFMTALNAMTDNGTKLINPKRYKGLMESYQTETTDSPSYILILTHTIPTLRAQLSAIMDRGHFDALFFATMSCPASVIHGESDPAYVCHASDEYAASYIASSTGFPEITVNAGRAVGNVPVGISFLGRAGDDAKLLGLAYSFESSK